MLACRTLAPKGPAGAGGVDDPMGLLVQPSLNHAVAIRLISGGHTPLENGQSPQVPQAQVSKAAVIQQLMGTEVGLAAQSTQSGVGDGVRVAEGPSLFITRIIEAMAS